MVSDVRAWRRKHSEHWPNVLARCRAVEADFAFLPTSGGHESNKLAAYLFVPERHADAGLKANLVAVPQPVREIHSSSRGVVASHADSAARMRANLFRWCSAPVLPLAMSLTHDRHRHRRPIFDGTSDLGQATVQARQGRRRILSSAAHRRERGRSECENNRGRNERRAHPSASGNHVQRVRGEPRTSAVMCAILFSGRPRWQATPQPRARPVSSARSSHGLYVPRSPHLRPFEALGTVTSVEVV